MGGVGSRNATCFRAETAWFPSVEYRRQLRSGLFREDFEIIVLFIVWILAGIMKSIVSRIGSVVMLSLVLVFSGVSIKDPVDSDDIKISYSNEELNGAIYYPSGASVGQEGFDE